MPAPVSPEASNALLQVFMNDAACKTGTVSAGHLSKVLRTINAGVFGKDFEEVCLGHGKGTVDVTKFVAWICSGCDRGIDYWTPEPPTAPTPMLDLPPFAANMQRRVSFSQEAMQREAPADRRPSKVYKEGEFLKDPVTEVISPNRLLIGSAFALYPALAAYQITHLVNLAADVATDGTIDQSHGRSCLSLALEDSDDALTEEVLHKTVEFLDAALAEESASVLVYCMAGISRSPSIATAYLMHKNQLALDDAVGLIQDKRPISDVSIHQSALARWETSLKAQTLATA